MTAKGIRFLFRQPLDATGVGSISALRRVVVLAILSAVILPPMLFGQGSPYHPNQSGSSRFLTCLWRIAGGAQFLEVSRSC
jgi:hypothetical protein